MDYRRVYAALIKPTWSPPAWVFGPVWTVLYVLIAISFGKILWMVGKGEIPFWIALPLVLNLLFNFAFTWVQFKLRNPALASIDIVLVLVTLIWSLLAIYPYVQWSVFIAIPYLLWVVYATVLQFSIAFLNRK